MLSKTKVRFIQSLQKKRVREEEQLYVIEGDKIIRETLMAGVPVKTLIARPEFLSSLSQALTGGIEEIIQAGFEELKTVSTLKTPHNAIAIVEIPVVKTDPDIILKNICPALDFIQDPGNLGTIIRSAAWFGIRDIVCSRNSVELYNPKVVQASMGAMLHVNVHYLDLRDFLGIARERNLPVYGTMTEGKSIYEQKTGDRGIILFGNESMGISDELKPFISERIMIPKFSNYNYGIDSLNISMAASIFFSEFSRKNKI